MLRKVVLLFAVVASFGFAQSNYELPEPVRPAEVKSIDVLDIPVSINVRAVALPYLFSLISDYVGYPIVLRDIDYPIGTGQVQTIQTAQAASQTTQANTENAQLQTAQTTTTQGQAVGGVPQSEYMFVSYFSSNKKLKHVLDEITGMLDLWWRKEDDRIVVYKYEHRVFHLNLPFLVKKIDEKADSLTLQYQREFIRGLDLRIQSVLKDPNSKVSVDEMGNIYVSARKSEMRFIQEIVKGINERFTKEIPLKMDVYIAREDDLVQSGVLLGYSKNTKIGSRQGTIGAGLNASGSGIFSISLMTPILKAQIDALAQTGKLISVESNVLYALNGQPMVYAPLSKTRIVSKYNLTFVSGVGGGEPGGPTQVVPTINVETEDISTGSTLIIVPYIVSEDTIAIDFYRRQQVLEELREQVVNLQGNENRVSLPVVSTRTNLNQTIMRKGQSLAIFSSSFSAKELRERGVPFLKDIPVLGLLFKHKEDSDAMYRLVIVITYGEQG